MANKKQIKTLKKQLKKVKFITKLIELPAKVWSHLYTLKLQWIFRGHCYKLIEVIAMH